MQTVIEKLMESDLILWSFPLYYFNVPGILKNLIDRQLPMSLPFMSTRRMDMEAAVMKPDMIWKAKGMC